ncbi:MAG: 3-deoxy-manno-octulosonate cytidylyltransferase [Bacteroidota bacterium]|jgi:3-deoxy-manno-octulosonate cytidylyltransferase (CMP-KDO synthetase)
MKVLGIIPARYSSTRFPGKPLVVIDGKSMIRRVYEQALSCTSLSEVIVATDDAGIENHVVSFGGKAMMTSSAHRSGTERCSEVCETMRKQGTEYDVIVNIQGDEPYIHPGQIEQVIGCFSTKEALIASLMKKITSAEELHNPNVVKVLAGIHGNALYFSRASVPFVRGAVTAEWLGHHDFFKHIGIYGYRPDVLEEIVKLPPSPLETAESLEQLRWLENGFDIILEETGYESVAIDSPADLLKLTNRG